MATFHVLQVLAQRAEFTAHTHADTIAPGSTVEINYEYYIEGSNPTKGAINYGVTRCKECMIAGTGNSVQISYALNSGGKAERFKETFFVTIDHPGLVEIPPGYAIGPRGDTVKSNSVKLYVIAGFVKNLFPLLNETQLFYNQENYEAFGEDEAFDAETRLTEMGVHKSGPFFVNAGIVYHSSKPAGTRKRNVATINKLVQEIVTNLKGRKGSVALGMFLHLWEPRCMFVVTDTSGIRERLDAIYQRYLPMRGYTDIYGKVRVINYHDFFDRNTAWEEVDKLEKGLMERHDDVRRQRKIFVRVDVPDSDQEKEYIEWAIENGYKLDGTEHKSYTGDRHVTQLVFMKTANAQPETLFNISMEHRNRVAAGNGCGYGKIVIEKAK